MSWAEPECLIFSQAASACVSLRAENTCTERATKVKGVIGSHGSLISPQARPFEALAALVTVCVC